MANMITSLPADKVIRYVTAVNNYFGFIVPKAADFMMSCARENEIINFKILVGNVKIIEMLKGLVDNQMSQLTEAANILWMNANFNGMFLYQNLRFFNYLSLLDDDGNSLQRFFISDTITDKRLDLFQLYLFTHTPVEPSLSVTLKSKDGRSIVLENNNDWFTDMLRKYSEDSLPDIMDIDQVKELLSKPKGRPSNKFVNVTIWGTRQLLKDYGIVGEKVTKPLLAFLCDYLDVLNYIHKECSPELFANIRSTISQMRKGKMRIPRFAQIEL